MGVSFEGYEVDDAAAAAAAAVAAKEEAQSESKAKKATKAKAKAKAKSAKSAKPKAASKASKSSSKRSAMPEGLEAEAAAAMALAEAMMKRRSEAEAEVWEEGLDRGGVEMVQSLRAFLAREGACAEPPLGSQLAVWLARTRARAAATDEGTTEEDGDEMMTPEERAALVAAGVELENFSAAWLGELQRYTSLRQRRGTLHAPAAVSNWVRQQRAAAAAGQLSRAQLRRLRAAGMSGLAGALMLDDSVMEVVEVLVDPESTEGALEALEASREVPLHLARMDIKQQLSMLSLRENVAAAEAAAAARAEAEATRATATATATATAGYKVRRVPARAAGRAPGRARNRQAVGGVRVKSSGGGGGSSSRAEEASKEEEEEERRRRQIAAETFEAARPSSDPEPVVFEAEKTLEYMRSQGY